MAYIPEGAMGYDRAITVFSPDGKLYQVDYAESAAKKGAIAIGVRCSEGIVLLAEKRITSPLMEPRSYEKIFKIDDHIGTAASGMIGDARFLVDKTRLDSQTHNITYNENIPVEMLAKKLGDFLQITTQRGGMRPFGTSLLIAGIDHIGPQIYLTHPSGALYEYKAKAIGQNSKAADDIFEQKYPSVETLDDAITLSLKGIATSMDREDLTKESLEMALIRTGNNQFEKVEDNALENYLAENIN